MTTTVSCNGCTACCHNQVVRLGPEDQPNLHLYKYRQMRIGIDLYNVLEHNQDGSCAHLTPFGCSIYADRPKVCRLYDCRLQYLIMSGKERKAHSECDIWAAAHNRLKTLDKEDRKHVQDYKFEIFRAVNSPPARQGSISIPLKERRGKAPNDPLTKERKRNE